MAENNQLEIVYQKIRNHPIWIAVIAFGAIIIYLGSFTDSLDKILTFKDKYFSEKPSAPKTEQVLKTKELERINKSIEITSTSKINNFKTNQDESLASQDTPHEPPLKESTDPIQQNEKIDIKKDIIIKPQIISAKTFKVKYSIPPEKITVIKEPPETNTENTKQDRKVSIIVDTCVSALLGETTSDRVDSVEALLPTLPNDLTAKEITKLLAYETTSHREQILELLVTKAKPRSLNPAEIPAVLGSETTSNRIRCIEIVAPYIKTPIPGFVAAKILGSETFSHRVRALRPISQLIERPLKENEVKAILRGTSTSDRTEAVKLLFGS